MESQAGKRAWLIAAIWFLAVVTILCQLANVIDLFIPYATTGATVAPDGKTIVAILPKSAAQSAGLRGGDVLMTSSEDTAFAHASVGGMAAGRQFAISFRRGSKILTATVAISCCSTQAQTRPDQLAPIFISVFVVIAAIVIAAWLGSLRPGIMTFCLFLAMLNAGNAADVFSFAPWAHRVILFVSTILTYNGLWPALLIFTLRFSDDTVAGWRIRAQRAAIVLLGLTQSAVMISALRDLLTSATSQTFVNPSHVLFNPGADEIFNFSGSICLLLAAAILIARYVDADIRVRAQIRWALSGTVISLLFGSYQLAEVALHTITGSSWLAIVGDTGFMLLPACSAYALLRTRYIDPAFVLNRATVFAVTAGLLALVIGGIDWLTVRYISANGLALALEACISIALGFLLNALHRRVETDVERILFRRRHEAAEYLRRLGATLSIATREGVIEEALAIDAPRELGLASGAFFRRNLKGDTYERTACSGWDQSHLIGLQSDDPLIRFLRTERSPLQIDDVRWRPSGTPHGIASPSLAIPVLLRGEVAAFVLYGAHRDHSEIDSSEQQDLVDLVEKSSAALDHIEALALREALGEAERRYSTLLSRTAASPA